MTIFHDNIIRSANLKAKGVIQATSTKKQGNQAFEVPTENKENGKRNMHKFLDLLGLRIDHISLNILTLRHSTNVGLLRPTPYQKGRRIISANDPVLAKVQRYELPCDLPGIEEGLDACICSPHNVFLGILHADCTPVCLYNPETKYFALIHAGALGTIFGIVQNTINCLKNWCDVKPENLMAYIGPCISEKSYDVTTSRHWEVIQEHWPQARRQPFVLKNILATQLLKAGVKKIETSNFSTDINTDQLFSNFLGKGTSGRNLTMIGF